MGTYQVMDDRVRKTSHRYNTGYIVEDGEKDCAGDFLDCDHKMKNVKGTRFGASLNNFLGVRMTTNLQYVADVQ